MLIAIDGYEVNANNRVGIGRYAYEVCRAMYQLRIASDELAKNVQFRIYLPDTPRDDMPKETEWWQYRRVSPKKFWTFVGLPFSINRDLPEADVVFSPTHYVPRFVSIPKVMTIMDLSFLSYPKLFQKRDLHKLIHWTRWSALHVKKIITISDYSRSAIMRTYRIPGDKVVVTYPGFNMDTLSTQKVTDIQKKYNIEKHYIVSVGTIQPRKNYVRLIEAFAQFLKTNKQKFGDVDLVIVGKKGWLYEDIFDAPKHYGIEKRVKFLQFVPDSDLPALYTHALCFALPSLYEGFGLPVLEAMAYGCPVVVSNVSSLPEIAGKAGIYVDPEDVGSITKGLLDAVRQRNLKQGTNRIKMGLEQVKKFTWENAARQTMRVLKEVGGGNGI